MASHREIDAMRLAILLSVRGLGTTSPNPPVGCVILDAHAEIVGTGYHQRKGEPHAETHALTAAGNRAGGGTAIVTLEPCNHVGRTPACRQALLDAKVARVVIALIDPTSRGEGGAAVLRDAGVEVEVGVLAEEARLVLGPWLHALDTGRPHVTAAYVIDRDGSSSLAGESLLKLRNGVDAVLYGDGRVAEGMPGSHGRNVFTLPGQPLSGTPADNLKTLYSGGVRSLLIVGDSAFVERYLQDSAVDRLVLYLPSSRHGPSPGQLVPPNFQLTGLSPGPEYLTIECSPLLQPNSRVRDHRR